MRKTRSNPDPKTFPRAPKYKGQKSNKSPKRGCSGGRPPRGGPLADCQKQTTNLHRQAQNGYKIRRPLHRRLRLILFPTGISSFPKFVSLAQEPWLRSGNHLVTSWNPMFPMILTCSFIFYIGPPSPTESATPWLRSGNHLVTPWHRQRRGSGSIKNQLRGGGAHGHHQELPRESEVHEEHGRARTGDHPDPPCWLPRASAKRFHETCSKH